MLASETTQPQESGFPVFEELKGKKILYGTSFEHGYDIILSLNDVLDFLVAVPDEHATLIVTSPPYNIGKPYEDTRKFESYLRWQKKVFTECKRILRPEGSLCWEIGNYIKNGEVFPLDVYFYGMLKELGFKLRNRIIWHFGHGLHASKRFSGRYEVILWFTKGDDYKFNLDDVRIPQKYPGKRAYKGPNKGKPSGNPKGKNPSDLWTVKKDWEEEIWNIPNVKSNHPEKTIHPCQFPIELVERLVLALTDEGDWVFDPFAGVGSTLIAGLLRNRRVMGVEKDKEYADVAYQRILAALNGTLKRRPFGKRIHQPKGTERVSRLPLEWLQEKNSKDLRN
jgi:adenine-specific DNA-methyltransferase